MSAAKLQGSDLRVVREDGLQVFANTPGYCRESSWCFASAVHFGSKSFWWVEDDDHESHFDTFCEALIEAQEIAS